MPALWITASKRPSLLTWSATVLAPAMVERSPVTAPRAPAAVTASRLRPSFRPCTTTSWPCSIRSLAAIRPRPSDDPVINTLATLRLLCRPAHQGYDPGPSTRHPCSCGLPAKGRMHAHFPVSSTRRRRSRQPASPRPRTRSSNPVPSSRESANLWFLRPPPPTSRDPFGYWSYERDRWFESGSLQRHSRCAAPHRIEARRFTDPYPLDNMISWPV